MTTKNKKKLFWIFILIIIILSIIIFIFFNKKSISTPSDSTPFRDNAGRLVVTASLFPEYDFAKEVGGDKAVVSLILPPGIEPHSFKPSDKELNIIKNSAIFFYTSSLMESWAPVLKNQVSSKTKVVAAADNLADNNLDPHVWLDFSKAQQMVDSIKTSYQIVDPANYNYYQTNADNYKKKLAVLDAEYFTGLKDCRFKGFISGGHNTFSYLAKRYGLDYKAAQGFIPDSSVDTEKILALSQELKNKKEPYVYYEELIMPYLAEILHQESGARIMPLNAAHNVARYDIENGVNFIQLMEADLKTLRLGLDCR